MPPAITRATPVITGTRPVTVRLSARTAATAAPAAALRTC